MCMFVAHRWSFVCNSTTASKHYISYFFCGPMCVWVYVSWEAGEAGSGSDDEQTLQGEIISHYPLFPDAALRL